MKILDDFWILWWDFSTGHENEHEIGPYPPPWLCPRRLLRDDNEQKRPVCTPTYEKRRQLKKTTKVKYENEDPPPPWVALWWDVGGSYEKSTRAATSHGESGNTNTPTSPTQRRQKNKRRGGREGHIKEAERRPMRNIRPHRSIKGEKTPPPVVAHETTAQLPLASSKSRTKRTERKTKGATRVLDAPPTNKGTEHVFLKKQVVVRGGLMT